MTTTTDPANATIKLVSHSMLFYWWPVWVCGLVLGALSMASGHRMPVSPDNDISVHMISTPNAGILFCAVLLVVVFSTNIPLRGLWSLVVLLGLVILALVFAGLDLWRPIMENLGRLHVYISAAGYLLVSIILLAVWLVTFFLYDPQRYITFTPGQLIVHREVGDMQQVYDTTNVTVEKRRSDFFRHVLLGFLSGDVVVQIGGQNGQQFELPNVLFAARKVQQVADLMKTRPIVTGNV
jgi:hypothetical protein